MAHSKCLYLLYEGQNDFQARCARKCQQSRAFQNFCLTLRLVYMTKSQDKELIQHPFYCFVFFGIYVREKFTWFIVTLKYCMAYECKGTSLYVTDINIL